jgi:hypothetical protein
MANYCCLNPNCLAQFNRSSSLNRHYSRNPSCSPFRHNGFDSPVFGTARPHGTKLLVPHEASTSRSSNVDPGKANVKASNQASDEKSKSSSGSVNSDDYASLGKLEHTDMSFSFFLSQEDKDHEEHQLAESESLFADSPGATAPEFHDGSTSSSSALVAQHEASLLLPSVASFSSSVSVSDDGPHSSTGPSIFMSLENSGSEHQHSESVHEEDSTSSLASSGSLSDYRDNCESLEAQFESLLYNTYDSDTNDLQSANDEDSDEDIANMPSEGHDEVMNYLLEDSFCMHEVLPARYQEQIKKLHPVEEELLIIMRKNHMSIKLFKKLMAWAKRARTSKYDFNYPTYQTVLDRMKKKYFLEAGSPPLRSTVIIGDPFPPMHVYRFSVLHQIKHLL